jgi:hypothetical protein
MVTYHPLRPLESPPFVPGSIKEAIEKFQFHMHMSEASRRR